MDPPWRVRPLIMAVLCAVAGVVFYHLVDDDRGRDALAAFVAVATILFVVTVEQRRLVWAAVFALVWGGVIALIVQNNRTYNVDASPFEWPFWSALLAVVVAAPLFQTWRDVANGAREWQWWRLPYGRLHLHAWTDAVIGAAALAFVGISMGLAFLIAAMFSLIGIDALRELLQKGWFVMGLAGAAFGGAVGLLRERDRLVGNLQRLVMVVLSVLAPILAVAVALFLVSLLGTGLGKLWASGFSTTALMLGASAFAVLLANAVIGNGQEDRVSNPLLRWAAPVLAVAVLPLAAIALWSLLLRIGQYGWTPERLWGMVAVLIALAYGAAGAWALARGRAGFDDVLRPMQQKLAIGLMLLATFLALPILDFGAISTRDQLARLQSGTVKPQQFDWAALAFDFGGDGRAALDQLAKSKVTAISEEAKLALRAKSRWEIDEPYGPARTREPMRPVEQRVRVIPADRPLDRSAYAAIEGIRVCDRVRCIARWTSGNTIAIISRYSADAPLTVQWIRYDAQDRQWSSYIPDMARQAPDERKLDMNRADVTVRPVSMEQLVVDGVPIGDVFVPGGGDTRPRP